MTKPEGLVLRKQDYFIKNIDHEVALELVQEFHYAKGGSKQAVYRHGLFHVSNPDEALGVAWWLPPTKAAAASVASHWQGVLSLTRLVLRPEVPTNGASFLLSQSVKIIKRDKRWHTLLTYADSGQGHTGGIYRASNWTYLGTVKGHPRWVAVDGRQVATKATTNRTYAQMTELGHTRQPASDKHKFVLSILDPSEVGSQKRPDRL